MPSKILLTGSNGFIGTALRLACKDKYSIISLSRDIVSDKTKLNNFIYVDLHDSDFAKHLPDYVDCVVHLAQSNEYRNFPDGACDMRAINIDATCKLLEWARKSGVKQFIYASTANVYGRQSIELLTEQHLTAPDSFYGASKLSAEHLARQYQAFFQVDILRLFTVYGPGQKGTLIPTIIERIITGKPITLAKGVGIYLSPIYVLDVVNIINKLIVTPGNKLCRLMNVCGDQATSLSELIKIMEKIIGKSAVVQMTDEEVIRFVGSNAKLKNYLGFYHFADIKITLETILQSTALCNHRIPI